MNILLLGKDGQLGWELQRSLAAIGHVTALGRAQADLSRPSTLAALVSQHQPQVIVNAAAYTVVDKTETDAATADAVNHQSPAALALAAKAHNALLVHYSTDYVFNGSGSQPWLESDNDATQLAPLNMYGATKLAGERAIQASGCRHLIFRTSWVYATRGANFAKTMLRLAAERETLKVVADQHGAPTGADWLADLSAHAISHTLRQPQLGGLYHAAAAGETTWHGYASYVVETARRNGAALKVQAIEPVGSEAFPTPARRPHNSRLNTAKLQAAFGLYAPPWQHGVARMLTEIA